MDISEKKRLLITGATGFLGSRLLCQSLEDGPYEIFATIRSPESEGVLSVATARQYEGERREAWPPARRRTQARPGSDSAVGKLMDAT